MSTIDDNSVSNPSDNETFENIAAARLSRRTMLLGGAATAGAAVAFGAGDAMLRAAPSAGALPARPERPFRPNNTYPAGAPLLGFAGIPTSTADTVVVPNGYTATVLIAWGDPVSDGPAFRSDASNTAEPSRPSNGACTTTASCTSRCTATTSTA